MTTISALPTAPSRDDPATFSDRADALVAALAAFVTQANAVGSEASAAAVAAAASALSAVNSPGTSATSTTSLSIGVGTKNPTIQTGKAFVTGQWVTMTSVSAPTSWMVGTIVSYSGSALSVAVQYFNGSGMANDWVIALSPPITFNPATAAQIRSGTSNLVPITPAGLFTASEAVTLTDASSIAIDFGAGINFDVTIGGNRTLANPSNIKKGQSGIIIVQQDGTGGRTLSTSFSGSVWIGAGGSPVLSATPNAVDAIYYYVRSTTQILFTTARGFF